MSARSWWAWLRAARAAARQRTLEVERRRLLGRAVECLTELGRYDLAARLIEDEGYRDRRIHRGWSEA